jgi:hypothetical protein
VPTGVVAGAARAVTVQANNGASKATVGGLNGTPVDVTTTRISPEAMSAGAEAGTTKASTVWAVKIKIHGWCWRYHRDPYSAVDIIRASLEVMYNRVLTGAVRAITIKATNEDPKTGARGFTGTPSAASTTITSLEAVPARAVAGAMGPSSARTTDGNTTAGAVPNVGPKETPVQVIARDTTSIVSHSIYMSRFNFHNCCRTCRISRSI